MGCEGKLKVIIKEPSQKSLMGFRSSLVSNNTNKLKLVKAKTQRRVLRKISKRGFVFI